MRRCYGNGIYSANPDNHWASAPDKLPHPVRCLTLPDLCRDIGTLQGQVPSDGLLQTKLKTRGSTDIAPAGVRPDYSRVLPATARWSDGRGGDANGQVITARVPLEWVPSLFVLEFL